MEPKVYTNRSSLAGSAARQAEAARPHASFDPPLSGSAAREAEVGRQDGAQFTTGVRMGLRLRAEAANATPQRLFPGPSARPAAISPAPSAAAATLSGTAPAHVQQAPYPASAEPGTVTSIGTRFRHAFQSLFT